MKRDTNDSLLFIMFTTIEVLGHFVSLFSGVLLSWKARDYNTS